MRRSIGRLWRRVYRVVTGRNTRGETAENTAMIRRMEAHPESWLSEDVLKAEHEYEMAKAELRRLIERTDEA